MTHVNSLVVVADRGSLRAYRVDPLPDRAPRLTPVQQLAAHVAETLRRENPAGWSLAAPKQILPLLLEHLPDEWSGKIVEKIGADLAKVHAGELADHFSSLKRDHRHSV